MNNDEIEPTKTCVWMVESSSCREKIKSAKIIFAIGKNGDRACLYGEQKLRGIARRGKAEALNVAELEIDFDTDELECLVAAVVTIKGSCCFRGERIVDKV
jgi:hypothetical protein